MDARPAPTARPVPDGRDRRAALFLFLLFASLYGCLSFGSVESVDAEMDYQTARGFLVHGDGAVHDDTPAGRRITSESFAGSRGRDGRFYSWHGPGRPLVGVACLAVGDLLARTFPELAERDRQQKRAQAHDGGEAPGDGFQRMAFALSSALFAAGTIAAIYLMARVLGSTRSAAFLLALLAALGTYLGPASRSALNACQATFLVAWAWYGWLRRGSLVAGVRAGSPFGAFVTGVLAGWAVWTRPTATFVVFALSCYALWVLVRDRRERSPWKDGTAYALGVLGIAVAIVAWNHHRFGDWSQWGHGDAIAGEQFVRTEPRFLVLNFVGEWISPGRGLLLFAPLLWLLPFAWFGRHAATRAARRALLLAVLLGSLWPILSSGWHGGPFYGPRYLLPVLPLALVALAPWVSRALERRGPARSAIYGLGLLGVVVQLPGFLVSYLTTHEVSIAAVEDELLPDAQRFVRAQVEPHVSTEQLALAQPLFEAPTRRAFDRELRAIAAANPAAAGWLADQVRAWDHEHQYLWHLWAPRYAPILVQARIAWRRLADPAPADEETIDLRATFGVERASEAFQPLTWEARGWRHVWPIAFDHRFGTSIAPWVFAGLEVSVILWLALAFTASRDRGDGTASSR